MTPLLPKLSKGVGKRKLIELLPILFVSNPFFTSLGPFFFFFAILTSKKLHLSWLTWASLSIILVSMIPCLQYIKEDLVNFNHFYEFLVCPYTWPVVETWVGRSSYPKSFSLVFDQMEKIFWGKNLFFGILRAKFHIFRLISLRPYKNVRKEPDLSL